MIFFPVKAEMLYFSNLYKGDHKGDHPRIYFGLKKLKENEKNPEILIISKWNRSSGGPPYSPPYWFSWKASSQLSLEKKSYQNMQKSRFYTKFNESIEKRLEMATVVSQHELIKWFTSLSNIFVTFMKNRCYFVCLVCSYEQ